MGEGGGVARSNPGVLSKFESNSSVFQQFIKFLNTMIGPVSILNEFDSFEAYYVVAVF